VARTVHCGELAVRHARFQPLRSILAEIYLCHACACHESLPQLFMRFYSG
jgi:hypothetical protein